MNFLNSCGPTKYYVYLSEVCFKQRLHKCLVFLNSIVHLCGRVAIRALIAERNVARQPRTACDADVNRT